MAQIHARNEMVYFLCGPFEEIIMAGREGRVYCAGTLSPAVQGNHGSDMMELETHEENRDSKPQAVHFEERVRDLIETYFLERVPDERWDEHTFYMLVSTLHALGCSLFPHVFFKDNPMVSVQSGALGVPGVHKR